MMHYKLNKLNKKPESNPCTTKMDDAFNKAHYTHTEWITCKNSDNPMVLTGFNRNENKTASVKMKSP